MGTHEFCLDIEGVRISDTRLLSNHLSWSPSQTYTINSNSTDLQKSCRDLVIQKKTDIFLWRRAFTPLIIWTTSF